MSVLYFLGGAMRAGKSTLARRLLTEAVEPDWYTSFTDREVLGFVADAVRFSRYLQAECAAHGLAYFDCSGGLERAVAEAFDHLVRPGAGAGRPHP